MQGIVPPTDLFIHLPGQPFCGDGVPGPQTQRVQLKLIWPQTCSIRLCFLSGSMTSSASQMLKCTLVITFSPCHLHRSSPHTISVAKYGHITTLFLLNSSSNFLPALFNHLLGGLSIQMGLSGILPLCIYLSGKQVSYGVSFLFLVI